MQLLDVGHIRGLVVSAVYSDGSKGWTAPPPPPTHTHTLKHCCIYNKPPQRSIRGRWTSATYIVSSPPPPQLQMDFLDPPLV